LKEIWNIFDFNGNGFLSLAEIDKACLDLFPQYYKKKPVLMRAYKAADLSLDGYIQFKEFENLVKVLAEYDKLFDSFKKIDVANDGRIDFDEFKKGFSLLGMAPASEDQMKKMFSDMDSNKGGKVLFDEFCIYLAKVKAQVNAAPEAARGTRMGLAGSSSAPAEAGPSVKVPQAGEPLTSIDPNNFQKMWEVFDYNGNGICSLAEIDRAVLMLLPQIAKNKPAIMRAYKAADTDENGYISRREFEKMLRLLSYYNDLFLLFEKLDRDNDRRVNWEEFKTGATIIGLNVSDAELKAKFQSLDRNGGGVVLFDEFCFYMAQQAASQPSTPRVRPVAGVTQPPAQQSVLACFVGSYCV